MKRPAVDVVRLSDLLEGLDTGVVDGDPAVPITGVSFDSRTVSPGNAFFCVRGYELDGHDFIAEAAGRGATAVLVEGPQGLDAARAALGPGGPRPAVAVVAAMRPAMGRAAANFYGHPSRSLRVIGVTGTNGKTTTVHLIRELLVAAGRPCGLVGTVQKVVGGETLPAGRTTPEAFDLQGLAREMVRAGDTHLAMEVASHALALERVAGFEFDVGVFTNLSQDHLDFHGDLESYFSAKARLFQALGTSYLGRPKSGRKAAVLNLEDAFTLRLAAMARVPVVTFGVETPEADIWAAEVTLRPSGATFIVTAKAGLGAAAEGIPAFEQPVSLSLTGRHNVSNALAALSVALIEGVEPLAAVAGLAGLGGAPGRFEVVDEGQDFIAVVDYAHSPDGLENVLAAARALGPGRIITVFGCGGNRDRGKRPLMGETVARYSDFCVVTSDNPRREDPVSIIEDILPGLRRAGRREGEDYVVCPDRAAAIDLGLRAAGPGDLVLVAGKGHETYQLFADRTIYFDDREVVREALRRRLGRGGGPSDG